MDAAEDLFAPSNQAIARGYDHVPYRPEGLDFLSVPDLRAMGLVYGCGERAEDVLDLGCGAGAQLALAATQVRGRLVGVDLASDACEEARRVLAPHGDRVEILNADLMQLTPERLGAFDVVYCLGVMSFVPAGVRRRLVELIGACLRPGGVAVVSYYTGAIFTVRASIAKTLLAGSDPGAAPAEQVRQARATLDLIKAELPADDPATQLQAAAVAHLAGLDDTMFYHEVLNPESVALETAWMERALRAEGVGFLARSMAATSQERALAMDIRALKRAFYAYSIFGKGDGALGAPHPVSPRLVWSTELRRQSSEGYDQPASYAAPGLDITFTVDQAVAQVLLDLLGEAPMPWGRAFEQAQARARELAPAQVVDAAYVANGLLLIWANRGVTCALGGP